MLTPSESAPLATKPRDQSTGRFNRFRQPQSSTHHCALNHGHPLQSTAKTGTLAQHDIEPGPRWTPQRDDSDDDYDRAVYAERAQWRQRAKDFNWKSVMPALHSWFMASN
ncbi:hypothetical protein H4Q26_004366 [Puccinia striiformis f. sp. tritici PST-130]|nr:hypothetical protein H4Q26_004366 [Puccinia striiformis f. sp. tritici PST-130]